MAAWKASRDASSYHLFGLSNLMKVHFLCHEKIQKEKKRRRMNIALQQESER